LKSSFPKPKIIFSYPSLDNTLSNHSHSYITHTPPVPTPLNCQRHDSVGSSTFILESNAQYQNKINFHPTRNEKIE